MPLPPDYAPQAGDVLVVHAKVAPDPTALRGEISVFLLPDSVRCWSVPPSAFISIHARALHVDDTVMIRNDDTYTPKVVRAIFGDYVWISTPAGHELRTVPATLLERVPPTLEPERSTAPSRSIPISINSSP